MIHFLAFQCRCLAISLRPVSVLFVLAWNFLRDAFLCVFLLRSLLCFLYSLSSFVFTSSLRDSHGAHPLTTQCAPCDSEPCPWDLFVVSRRLDRIQDLLGRNFAGWVVVGWLISLGTSVRLRSRSPSHKHHAIDNYRHFAKSDSGRDEFLLTNRDPRQMHGNSALLCSLA